MEVTEIKMTVVVPLVPKICAGTIYQETPVIAVVRKNHLVQKICAGMANLETKEIVVVLQKSLASTSVRKTSFTTLQQVIAIVSVLSFSVPKVNSKTNTLVNVSNIVRGYSNVMRRQANVPVQKKSVHSALPKIQKPVSVKLRSV